MPPTLPPFDAADFQGEITLDHVIPALQPQYSPLPADLRPELAAALQSRGINRLYSHQAESYAEVRRGRHLAVVTPTASGKTPPGKKTELRSGRMGSTCGISSLLINPGCAIAEAIAVADWPPFFFSSDIGG